MDYIHRRRKGSDKLAFRREDRAIAIDSVFTELPTALETRLGMPRPDWAQVHDWVEARYGDDPEQLDQAWHAIAKDWLDRLIAALPAGYSLTESAEFLLVSDRDPAGASRLLSICEHSRRVILKFLDGVASDEGYGKHVVLAFADHDRYYDYILDFYPDEGEFAHSGGMYLNPGYGHIVVNMSYTGQHERTIAHELCHNLMGHLELPIWLDEGATQVIEDMVVESSYFGVDRELVERHREYWHAESIQTFWTGDSFYDPDGQELSYHLAVVLFRNLCADFPRRVKEFLKTASGDDAGDAALRAACGRSLAELVSQFLGEGDWGPNFEGS